MIRAHMTLSEFLRRFPLGAEVLDDFEIHFEPDFDSDATLGELCEESGVSFQDLEEELLLLDEEGGDQEIAM